MRPALLAATALLTLAPAAAQDDLAGAVAEDYERHLGALFEHLHANPELSFREFETAKRLARELEAAGFTVTTGIGQTGVVAVMENGEGPTVMVRADMDGLPVKEDTELPYESRATQEDVDGVTKPVMHACGHDVHVTSLVGTARQLSARKDDWSGTLVLIGQPAEEKISGARAMIQDGLYRDFPKPDFALAFHVSAQAPTDTITVPKAAAYSSSDSVDITVRGVGAHGAYPHMGLDPVLVASQIVVSLQSVVSRTLSPLDPGVITVGSIHGGSKHNIIPDEVTLQLTVRSDDPDVRAQLLDGIDRVAEGVARAHGTPDDLLPIVKRSETQTTPPTVNDTALATRIEGVFADHFGDSVLRDEPRTGMGAEDFAYFVERDLGVRGLYFAVGGTPPEDVATAPSHHSPFFKVAPEPSVTLGTEAMVVAVMELMKPGGAGAAGE